MSAFDSPWLIVDRYVLHRLPMPRHSPCALISLTFLRIMCPLLISQLDFIVVFLPFKSKSLKLQIFVNLVVSISHLPVFSFQGTFSLNPKLSDLG